MDELGTAEAFFQSGSARTALLTAGVPPVAIHWVYETRWNPHKGLFGGGGQNWPEVISGRGWILGEFTWRDFVANDDGGQDGEKGWLTALLDVSPEDSRCERYRWGLARVHRVMDGYQALDLHFVTDGDGEKELLKAAQAVKRLAGLSS